MTYREEALRTFKSTHSHEDILLAMVGIVGESGEIVDWFKKYRFHTKKPNRELLLLELGDILWYVELLSYLMKLKTDTSTMTVLPYQNGHTDIKDLLIVALEISKEASHFTLVSLEYLEGIGSPNNAFNWTCAECAISNIKYHVQYIAEHMSSSLEEVQQMNIDKLNKRYPDPTII